VQTAGVVIQIQSDCVLASVQKDLDSEFIRHLSNELLDFCFNKPIKGVILDLSGVTIIDSDDFKGIRKIISSIELMGYPCILSGLGAPIVSSLVSIGADFEGIKAYNSLDQAISYFK
jgi:anti-anti-sigma regulatory factor